jgi:MFS family permease
MLLLALATALFGLSTTVAHLVVARAVQGISAAATWSAGLALLADTCDPARLGEKDGDRPLGGRVRGRHRAGYRGSALRVPGLRRNLPPPGGAGGRGRPRSLHRPGASLRQERAEMLPGKPPPAPCLRSCGRRGRRDLRYRGPLPPCLPARRLSASPATIGIVFAVLAVAAILAHPAAGRIYDRRRESRHLISGGLLLSAAAIALSCRPLPWPLPPSLSSCWASR